MHLLRGFAKVSIEGEVCVTVVCGGEPPSQPSPADWGRGRRSLSKGQHDGYAIVSLGRCGQIDPVMDDALRCLRVDRVGAHLRVRCRGRSIRGAIIAQGGGRGFPFAFVLQARFQGERPPGTSGTRYSLPT